MMENVIEIETLRKEYKGFTLGDISFNVPKGYVTGLIGPNGAGKTTAIGLLTGLLAPTAGRTEVFGIDVATRPVEAKRLLGWEPEWTVERMIQEHG